MIAIHFEKGNNFSGDWKSYCEEEKIPYKIVSCYDSDIIDKLKDCKALLWHINHFNYKDQIFSKYLIKSLDKTGIKIFPDYSTLWHFDDKIAQKYLLEAINAPLVKSVVFYDKLSAKKFIDETTFPKVFKLRKGSGSRNVILVKNRQQAFKLTQRAFGRGFAVWDMTSVLKERFRKYKLGKESLLGLLKGVIRIFIGTPFTRMSSKEKGYVYFQDFMPNNKFDQRIIVIGDKAFALKRMVRENDFRASGSGSFFYDKDSFDLECIKISFNVSKELDFQCMAYDFVYDENMSPKIVEVSYGFNPKAYRDCPGYWDSELKWHEGAISPQKWMLQGLL